LARETTDRWQQLAEKRLNRQIVFAWLEDGGFGVPGPEERLQPGWVVEVTKKRGGIRSVEVEEICVYLGYAVVARFCDPTRWGKRTKFPFKATINGRYEIEFLGPKTTRFLRMLGRSTKG